MNYNPRKIALAFGTAAVLTLGPTGCGANADAPRVETPTYTAPDCDLDDLEQGDPDCNDPVAYAAAVHKHGAKKVADAKRKYAEKKARERLRKEVDKRLPQTKAPAAAPRPVAPAAPAAAPRTNSTRSTSGGGLFGGGSKAKSNSNSGGGFNPFGSSRRRK